MVDLYNTNDVYWNYDNQIDTSFIANISKTKLFIGNTNLEWTHNNNYSKFALTPKTAKTKVFCFSVVYSNIHIVPPYKYRYTEVYEAPIADKFSFPSGHSSRAVMLTVLGLHLLIPLKTQTKVLLYIFPIILGFTRVAMGRHYLFDVLAGFVLGYFEGLIALQLPHEIPNLLSQHIPIIFVE